MPLVAAARFGRGYTPNVRDALRDRAGGSGGKFWNAGANRTKTVVYATICQLHRKRVPPNRQQECHKWWCRSVAVAGSLGMSANAESFESNCQKLYWSE
ncbi:hypothetical protein [Bradyrhizobium sp. USDA 3364]